MDMPKPGTYACVRTGGFYAWLIRVGTRSKFNHAFIVVDDQGGIIEADPGGARRSNVSAYGTDRMLYDTAEPVSDVQRDKIIAKAETLLGTPYGWTDIARLALRSAGVKWGWLTAAADNERAMICSQLVAICGDYAGLDWNCGRDNPAAVTPGDLAARMAPPTA